MALPSRSPEEDSQRFEFHRLRPHPQIFNRTTTNNDKHLMPNVAPAALNGDSTHHTLFARTPLRVPLMIVAVIAGGLWVDAAFGWPGQWVAIALTFLVFGWLYRRSGTIERRMLILCTVISGVGEVFLSLIWGLYDYQFHNVPLFVPPGHALLMTLGLIATHLFTPRFATGWVSIVVIAAIAWGIFAWIAHIDRFGALLCSLFLLCTAFGKARALYATIFMLALIMELYGTALGNWRWAEITPWLGLKQSNPPYSAGAFYGALDVLVLAALAAWQRLSPANTPALMPPRLAAE